MCVIGFSVGSYYTGQNMINLKQNGLVTNGTVDVLYNPESAKSAIIDRGILNWGITNGLFIMVLLSL